MPEIVATAITRGGLLSCGHMSRNGDRITKVYMGTGKTTRSGNGPGSWMCTPCAFEACRASAPDDPDEQGDHGKDEENHDQDASSAPRVDVGSKGLSQGVKHERVVPPPRGNAPRKGQRSRSVRVPVVGGTAGRPRRVPNPATKRGWSVVKAHWMVPEPLPSVIPCGGHMYRLVYEDGKPYYVCQPESSQARRLRAMFTPALG